MPAAQAVQRWCASIGNGHGCDGLTIPSLVLLLSLSHLLPYKCRVPSSLIPHGCRPDAGTAASSCSKACTQPCRW